MQGRPIIDYIVDEMLTMPDLKQVVVVSNHRFAKTLKNGKTRPADNIVVVDDKLPAMRMLEHRRYAHVIEQLKIDDDFLL